MPGRNIIKYYDTESFYHVYNRGVNKRKIFCDDEDNAVFLHLLKRTLDPGRVTDASGRQYVYYGDQAELLAFCLMPNHFHLLWFQHDMEAITRIMRSVITAYVMYFNKKYARVGPLFQQRFRAVPIIEDSQLQHISRYIHLNPRQYTSWQWSSLPYYEGKASAPWVQPSKILELFDSVADYMAFLEDYQKDKSR